VARLRALVVIVLVTAAPSTALASSGGLHVIPFPGTPDASPTTTIIFSSLTPAEISSVRVLATRSGVHSGHLSALPDGDGTSLTLDRPFAPGERVAVTASLASASAGTASGAPGARTLRFSFGVAVSAPAGTPPAAGLASAATGQPAYQRFHSFGLHPAIVRVGPDADHSSGDILLNPRHAGRNLAFQEGPMILDGRGNLVWFHYVPGKSSNLEVQHYLGRPVLTWWQTQRRGVGGEDVIMNRSYKTVAVVHPGNGYKADEHEFQITPQGTALIPVVIPVRTNLTSVGGPASGIANDDVVQEVDIKTGRVVWEWHSLGHIPLTASYAPYRPGHRFGYFHLNSIQQLPDHRVLISARHTWAVYEIDQRTGHVIWTLGGKNSSFSVGAGANFSWQHDAHLVGDTLTVFDDASNGFTQQESSSSGKVIRLDFANRTASLVHAYHHFPPLTASSQGSAQLLPGGDMFVGWGNQPDFSEYRPDGHLVLSGSFPSGVQSYRAYRFQWSGQPATKPSVALAPQPGGSVKVYASWNGATGVAAWRVLGGPTPHPTVRLGERARTGFETEMQPGSEPAYFEVQALDSHGHVLGTSAPHADPAHVAVFGSSGFVETSTGVGGLGVGCFARQTCHLGLTVSSGGTVLARSVHPVARGTGRLMEFKLSRGGLGKLMRAPGHRLPVMVTVDDSVSKTTATRRMTLIPYSVSGKAPAQDTTSFGDLTLLQDTGFVSTKTRIGGILAACYGSAPCRITGTRVSANSKQIAQASVQYVGLDELSMVRFKLSSAGLSMLRRARGNQLGAGIVLTEQNERVGGSIDLVGYT
jgi:Arylsulfotransferase (ASST)